MTFSSRVFSYLAIVLVAFAVAESLASIHAQGRGYRKKFKESSYAHPRFPASGNATVDDLPTIRNANSTSSTEILPPPTASQRAAPSEALQNANDDKANSHLQEIKNILKGSTSERRNQLLKMIADVVKAQAGNCPSTLPASMCRQPLTFFLWMKEVRNQEKEKQLYDSVRKLLIELMSAETVNAKKPASS